MARPELRLLRMGTEATTQRFVTWTRTGAVMILLGIAASTTRAASHPARACRSLGGIGGSARPAPGQTVRVVGSSLDSVGASAHRTPSALQAPATTRTAGETGVSSQQPPTFEVGVPNTPTRLGDQWASPVATSAHGAVGSAQAAHLAATVSATGYAQLIIGVTQSTGVDLSSYAGIAFSARGVGMLRTTLPTADLDAAANWDAYGKAVVLTPNWRRHTIRFDDSDFSQGGWGASAAFSPSNVIRIVFGLAQPGLFDFWIDDVVLLKAS